MNIIGKRKIFYIISGLVVIFSIIAILAWGLNYGIDFKGGTLIELDFTPSGKEVDLNQVKESFSKEEGIKSLSAQKTGENSVLIKAEGIDKEKYNSLKDEIKNNAGDFKEARFETVGPTVSSDLKKKAFISNESIKQTITRSINTSFTVLIALLSVLIFGGESIFSFVLALIVGIIVGTYSSIFVASALLVDWTEWRIKKAE